MLAERAACLIAGVDGRVEGKAGLAVDSHS
jgi:hypothetical protein